MSTAPDAVVVLTARLRTPRQPPVGGVNEYVCPAAGAVVMVRVSTLALAVGAAEALLRLKNCEGVVPTVLPASPMLAPKLGPVLGAAASGRYTYSMRFEPS